MSQKISEMVSATTLDGTELVPVVQTTNKKSTVELLRGWASLGATANAILRTLGTDGESIQVSEVTIDDNGNVVLPTGTLVLRETRILVVNKTVDNIFIGKNAGNTTDVSVVGGNLGIGENALSSIVDADGNTSIGYGAGASIENGNGNIQINSDGVVDGNNNIEILGSVADPNGSNQISIADFLVGDYGAARWLGLKGNSAKAAEFRLYEDTDTGNNYTAFKPGTQSADITYTLPTAAPTSDGQSLVGTTGGVLSWGNPDGVVLTAQVTITSAQILSSNTTPVQIVAAPGAGKVIVLIRATTKLIYATTPYATNVSSTLRLGTSIGNNVTTGFNLIDGSVNKWSMVEPITANFTNNLENLPLNFTTLTGDPTAGDSDMIMTVYYTIVDYN